MSNGLLLWVDDEIELLRAHIIFSREERLRSGYSHQRHRRHRPVPSENLRPYSARRDDARPERTGDPAEHQRNIARHAGGYGNQERGGKHHGSGHRLKDCRLSDKAGKPEPDTPYAQKEHSPQGDCNRNNAERLSAKLPGHSPADKRLQDIQRLDERL